jgi:hypothetical protein
MTRKFLIVTALVAGVAATADAQICAGTAPFSAGNMRVGAGAEFPDGAKSYGGEFAWGASNGAYLGGTIDRLSIDNSDVTAMDFGANGGYEMRFESMPKLRFCPTASLGYMNGPDFGAIETSTIHYSFGGAVGSVLSASDNLAIIPSAGLSWVGARAKATQGGTSATASDNWGEARLAAGFVFNRAITVAPVVTIPMGLDGAKSTVGFAMSYNFGRSGGVMQQGGQRKGNRKR